MRSGLGHIQFNVRAEHTPFYRELFTFLGWEVIYDADGSVGVLGKNEVSFWFIGQVQEGSIDYDGPGMNHIGISAESIADVDAAADYLRGRGVDLLFDTPRHRPDFASDEQHTYYQIMFETPDRLLLEFVYTGPK
jgi:catechol 2,3-dioxygenase-like lactoylglutathione lyase family enzyme